MHLSSAGDRQPAGSRATAIAWEEPCAGSDARCSSCLEGAARLRLVAMLEALLLIVESSALQ
jgi:hypothetical protein